MTDTFSHVGDTPAPPAAAPALSPGELVSYAYTDHRGDHVDTGVVVRVESRSHPQVDGSSFDEGPHVVVAWLRDVSDPLPVELFTKA